MKEKIFCGLLIGATAVLVTAIVSFVTAVPVYIFWNWVMPEVFGLPVITYWQAWGIAILADILFNRQSTGKENQA